MRPREMNAVLPDSLCVKHNPNRHSAHCPDNRLCCDVTIVHRVGILGTDSKFVGCSGAHTNVGVCARTSRRRYPHPIFPRAACSVRFQRATNNLVVSASGSHRPRYLKRPRYMFHRGRYLGRTHHHTLIGCFRMRCTVAEQTLQDGNTIIRFPYKSTFLVGEHRLSVNRINHCGILCICNQFEVRAVLHVEGRACLVRPTCRPRDRHQRVILAYHNSIGSRGVDVSGVGNSRLRIYIALVGDCNRNNRIRCLDLSRVCVCVPYQPLLPRSRE